MTVDVTSAHYDPEFWAEWFGRFRADEAYFRKLMAGVWDDRHLRRLPSLFGGRPYVRYDPTDECSPLGYTLPVEAPE